MNPCQVCSSNLAEARSLTKRREGPSHHRPRILGEVFGATDMPGMCALNDGSRHTMIQRNLHLAVPRIGDSAGTAEAG